MVLALCSGFLIALRFSWALRMWFS